MGGRGSNGATSTQISTRVRTPPVSIGWFCQTELDAAVRARVLPAEVVLDVGAGIRPQTLVHSRVHICVEPHATYVRRLLNKAVNDPRLVVLAVEWSEAMSALPDKSVDAVIALDFIEHLSKLDGERFLLEAERLARRQIVLFTPLGFYPQGVLESHLDRWGLDGGEWQAHRSGWTPADFDDRWHLLCCRSYHFLDEHDQVLEEPFGALWAIRDFEQPPPPRTVRAASASHRLVDRFWTWAGSGASAACRLVHRN